MTFNCGAPWAFIKGEDYDADPDAFTVGRRPIQSAPEARWHVEKARQVREHQAAVRAAQRAAYLAARGW